MYSHRYKTWDEAVGLPETFSFLERLPKGLAFPPDFPEPIHYDEQRKRLIYRGFMCSVSFHFLHSLTTDPHYIAAVDALFQATSSVLQKRKKPKRGKRVWFWLLGVGCLGGALAAAWKWMHH